MSTSRVALWVFAAPATALAAALAARHGWVQAPGMAARCEATPSVQPCVWREWVIQAFLEHRLSTTALALAAGAWALCGLDDVLWRSRAGISLASTLATMGLSVAVCGLVLYDADRSAWAAVLCGACWMQLRAKQAAHGGVPAWPQRARGVQPGRDG